MKKLFGFIFLLSLTLVLTACGPDSKYYNVGDQTVYYYENSDLVIDPYSLFEDHDKDWIDDVSEEEMANIREEFYVEVEYRLKDTLQGFKSYEVNENNMIVVENPVEKFSRTYLDENDKEYTVKEEFEYEFKLHFIHKETEDPEKKINYIGVVKLSPSDINSIETSVTVDQFDSYNLLDNVILEGMTDDTVLDDLYVFTYTVVDEDGDAISVTSAGKATFTYPGTFTVTINAAEIIQEDENSGDGGTDGDSGASGDWGASEGTGNVVFLSNAVNLAASTTDEVATGEEYIITYTIIVE